MAQALCIEKVTHCYNAGEPVLKDIEVEIEEGEFLTLLGPSGCGKTTLLRIMAGFLKPTDGRVRLHGDDVTNTPPHKRQVNLVFQRASLFPHLDVYDNLAFGLQLAKVPKSEVQERVREALALVRLEGFAHRRTNELSGGQAQRIALARALINRPKVLLMDEPLSALDMRIRLEMEVELRRLHRETGATFVYVTHDQHEALALSDRIAVFDRGEIAQLGSPKDVYQEPSSPLTARFVGDANVLAAAVRSDGNGNRVAEVAGYGWPLDANSRPVEGPDAWAVVRQEDVDLRTGGNGSEPSGGLPGTVRDVGFRGAGYAYQVEVPGLADLLKAEAPAGAGPPLALGSEVTVAWSPDAARLLPRQPAA